MTQFEKAVKYCETFGTDDEQINDAANIYASSYDQYCALAAMLEKRFSKNNSHAESEAVQ